MPPAGVSREDQIRCRPDISMTTDTRQSIERLRERVADSRESSDDDREILPWVSNGIDVLGKSALFSFCSEGATPPSSRERPKGAEEGGETAFTRASLSCSPSETRCVSEDVPRNLRFLVCERDAKRLVNARTVRKHSLRHAYSPCGRTG